MSSFYDDASLVMIPSCYKVSTVLCEKPTDGSGDLTFTRTGDTATRVNSSGLVEKVRTNLALYSEDFTNASWTKAVTVTANAGTAPNGTTTADLIYPSANSSNSVIFNGITIANSTEYTNSIYVKASGKTWTYIRGINDGPGVWFDVANGVLGATQSGVSGTITSVGSGWYRCSVTQTSSSTTGRLVVLVVDGNGSTVVTASGTNGLLIWGAQQETGVATAYIPTTTAAVSVGPVANLPRLDYLDSTCGKLLLEPQRTNLLQFSEQFNNAYWSLSGATITSNTTVAPDGTQSADTLTGVSGNFRVFRVVSGLSNIDYSFSVFVKQGTSNTVKLDFVNVSDGPIFNFTTKTFTTVSGFTTRFEQHANGWFRLFATRVSNTTSAGLGINVAGAGQTVFIWGAQMEAGSYGTSYIPTLAASATRSVDDATKTGITSLIGQTEGTIFVDFQLNQSPSDTNGRLLQLWATNDTTNAIIPIVNQSRQLQITTFGASSGSAIISAGASTLLGLGQNKIAVAYTSTSVVVYRNGVLFASGNPTGFFPTSLTSLDLGGSSFAARNLGNPINQALLFKTRLTNAQLAELTTI